MAGGAECVLLFLLTLRLGDDFFADLFALLGDDLFADVAALFIPDNLFPIFYIYYTITFFEVTVHENSSHKNQTTTILFLDSSQPINAFFPYRMATVPLVPSFPLKIS